MKIILFTDSPVFAGTERHMLDLACGLRDLAVSVRIACPQPGALADRAAAAGMRLLPIPKRGLIDRNAIRILADELCSGRVDLIHAHNGRTHIAAAFAVRRAGRGACVDTQHFLAPARTNRQGPAAWIASWLRRRAAASTAHTIAISNAVRAAALQRRDVPAAQITTVHNGSSMPQVATDAAASARTRADLGLASDSPFIFCAARLEAEKDLPTLLAGMALVIADHPSARCLIAGEGGQRPVLQRQINALHLEQYATLLGFREDVPGLLQACDLFVLPSTAESFGLVLLEAMALAKPVVAVRAGGPTEIVADGQTGLLVPPSDPEALAQAINTLLADPAMRRTFGAAGRQRYLSRFTVDRMAREVLTIYERCLPSCS